MNLLVDRGAIISDCGTYRYTLFRILGADDPVGRPELTFIGLNPSTADAQKDDPTIRRCIGFARRLGFDRMNMLNLFAYRATDPKNLPVDDSVFGPGNSNMLTHYMGIRGLIVCAWGATPHPMKERAISIVRERALAYGRDLRCLGTTKNGDPRHPLYLPADAPLQEWPGAQS